MFTKDDLLKIMIEYFPIWSDIRKRRETSNGGKLLYKIAEEENFVQDNLAKYKKQHFPRFYEGKENSIPYKVYTIYVGEIENTSLIYPKKNITDNYMSFSRDPEKYALYYDGMIMFQECPEEVVYIVNEREYRQVPKENVLWNIFDEFGLISGKERKKGESNEEFLARIYDSYRYMPDSTKEGIRNTIRNYLTGINPEEIKIRKLNEKDLEDINLYETLNRLNQDLYNQKVWDVSLWDHDFANISYAPHPWGEPLKEIKEGVAQGDSLKVVPEEELMKNSTDIQIFAYDQSTAKINDYINQTPVSIPITLQANAYKQDITPIPYGLQIHASRAIEITQDNIMFEGYKKEKVDGLIPIELLEKYPHENDHIRVKQNILKAGNRYELVFSPDTPFKKDGVHFGDMSIEKVKLDGVDIRHETPLYRMEDGVIKNNNIAFFGSSISNFNDSNNFKDNNEGMGLSNFFDTGTLSLNIKESMKNQYVFYSSKCERSNLLYESNKLSYKNTEVINDKIYGDNTSEIEINSAMNDFYIELEEGSAILRVFSNDEKITEEIITAPYTKTLTENQPRDLKVEIKGVNQESFIISKLEYNHYEITFETEKGEIRNIRDNAVLPEDTNNILTITMNAVSSKEPVLEYVFIGSPFRERDAYKIMIDTLEKDKELVLSSESYVILNTYDGEDLIESIEDFSTVSSLLPESEEAIVKIDTDKYQELAIEDFSIYRDFFQGVLESYIVIPKGKNIRHAKVKAITNQLISVKSLDDIVSRSLGEKIYFDNISEQLSIEKDNDENHFVFLKKEVLFNESSEDINTVKAKNLPENVDAVFYIDATNRRVYTDQYDKDFSYVFFRSSQSRNHISHYHGEIVTQEKDIELPKIFHPPIESNRLMVYQIKEVVGDEISASFDGKEYSLGRKLINLKVNKDSNFYEQKEIKYSVPHRARMQIELEPKFNYQGEEYDLHKLSPIESKEYDFDYHTSTNTQDLVVLSTKYNKLDHSNVLKINSILVNNQEISEDKYELLEKEGILIWNTDEFVGEDARIEYDYEYLRFVSLKDLSILYKKIEYSIDAYNQREPLLIKNIKDSTDLPESMQGASRYILNSSNPIFDVQINNDRIEVVKNEKDDIYFYPGYYYQNEREYYKFANDHKESIEKFGGVELINTKTIENNIFLERSAANLIPNSFMERDKHGVIHNVDFTKQSYYKNKKLIESVSPCNIFSKWKKGNMNASFSEESLNRDAIHFVPKNEYSYALIKIGPANKEYISIAGKGGPIWIGENIPINGIIKDEDPTINLIGQMNKENDVYYTKVDLQNEKEYYIAIFKEIWIDSILFASTEKEAKNISTHKSNITKLGWQVPISKNKQENIRIFPEFLELDKLEVSDDYLQLTNTVQWGSTLLQDWRNKEEFDRRSTFQDVRFYEDRIIFESDNGFYETEYIYIDNPQTIFMGLLKINNVLHESFKGFNVEVYTTSSINSPPKQIGKLLNGNIINIDFERVQSYIKFKIRGSSGKTIESISFYVQHRGSENLRSEIYSRGNAITPIYRLKEPGDYIATKINTIIPNTAKCYIRGVRKDYLNKVNTKWIPISIDSESGNIVQSTPLRGYQYIQLKFELEDAKDKIPFKEIQVQLEEVTR